MVKKIESTSKSFEEFFDVNMSNMWLKPAISSSSQA